jgi:DNA-binding PadR family transcriptional regulator
MGFHQRWHEAREHFHEHHAMHHHFGGRHGFFNRGGPAGGRGGMFGDDEDSRGPGGRGSRMFGQGDLRLLLLSLIEQQPRHGYELIRTIEEIFAGQYSPSPGAVYPTLTMLEELGHAQVDATDGGKKRYAITEAGVAHLDQHRDEIDALMKRMNDTASRMARHSAPAEILQAMHEIKHALLARSGVWSTAEAGRVTGILRKAAAAIASGRGEVE